MDAFTLIAEPTRREILDRLRTGECDVGALVSSLGRSQPLISKHLRVLRDSGAVSSAVSGRRRVYRLTDDPLPEVLRWVAPYHALWSASFDRLEAALAAGDADADDAVKERS